MNKFNLPWRKDKEYPCEILDCNGHLVLTIDYHLDEELIDLIIKKVNKKYTLNEFYSNRGLCQNCGSLPVKGLTRCQRCRKSHNERERKRHAKRTNNQHSTTE